MYQKENVLNIYNRFHICLCSKRIFLGIFCVFDLLPFFSPTFHATMKCVCQYIYSSKWHFFAMVPWHLQRENLFCLYHCKNCWTVTMDHVGLKIGLLWTSSSMGTPLFILDVKQSGPGWVQRPITYFKGARDVFMVHDVISPSSIKFVKEHEIMGLILLWKNFMLRAH